MKKENLYYSLAAISGLLSILMVAAHQHLAFLILFVTSSILLIKGLYEDMDNLKY
jgi:hypothetical protein